MKNKKFYILTGLSGSGKSTAMAAFEDAGFYCVDNMPMTLLPKFLELPVQSTPRISGYAFVMDMRADDFISNFNAVMSQIREKGFHWEIIFLEADEDILVSRYSQTRRHHPVGHQKNLLSSIRDEKKEMLSIRTIADRIIDTSPLNVHQLKAKITEMAREKGDSTAHLKINVLSFGFKYGIPREADLVMDMRFLKNPYFDPQLKPLDGRDRKIHDFIFSTEVAGEFMKRYINLLDYLIPLYEKEGKAYLTIAVGCTGGRHRSVAVARKLFEHLNRTHDAVGITHRDIERDTLIS